MGLRERLLAIIITTGSVQSHRTHNTENRSQRTKHHHPLRHLGELGRSAGVGKGLVRSRPRRVLTIPTLVRPRTRTSSRRAWGLTHEAEPPIRPLMSGLPIPPWRVFPFEEEGSCVLFEFKKPIPIQPKNT